MNAKYILFVCFLMSYLVIQCVANETLEQFRERIAKENLFIRETYELALAHFKLAFGSKLTKEQVVFVLRNYNRKAILQYFREYEYAEKNRSNINADLFGDIVRKVCQKNGTEVLDFLGAINKLMRIALGYY